MASICIECGNPAKFKDYSEDSLKNNGYVLRNYLTLMAYDDVLRRVLQGKQK